MSTSLRKYRIVSVRGKHEWVSPALFHKLEEANHALDQTLKTLPMKNMLFMVQFYNKDHGWLLVAGSERFT